MNPYQILNLTPPATDEEIRGAYLNAVKSCPPERDPEQFQRLAAAYERIKDEDTRLNALLDPPQTEASSPGEIIVEYARHQRIPRDVETLHQFLRALA